MALRTSFWLPLAGLLIVAPQPSSAANFLPLVAGAASYDVLQKPFREADLLAAVNARLLPAVAPVL